MFRKQTLSFCECCCGEQVSKSKNRYIRGHNSRVRSEETIRKIGAAAKGRIFTKEHKKRMAIEIKRAFDNDPNLGKKISKSLKGRKQSQKEKENKSIASVGQYVYDCLSNYEWMYEQLIIKDKSPTLVAKEIEVSCDTIRSWSQRLGIEYRNHGKDWLEDPVILANIGRKSSEFHKGRKYSEKRKRNMNICRLEPNGKWKYDHLSSYNYMYEQLITRDKSITQVGRELDVSENVMRTWARKLKIKYHSHSNDWQKDPVKLAQATRKQSKSMKRLYREDKEFLKMIQKSWHRKPNSLEKGFQEIIEKLFPNEYKYVGNGEIWIGGKNPDFINVNGKKIVLEVFGNYWHNIEDVQTREKHFEKYGFQCLCIWESDFYNRLEWVEQNLLRFHNGN